MIWNFIEKLQQYAYRPYMGRYILGAKVLREV